MASGNQISICNRSLLAVGGRVQISSLTEGSTEANCCAVLFSPTFEQLARTAYWNALRKQAPMTLVQAAQGTPENQNGTTYPLPPVPWLYAYQVPADSLACRWLVPSLPTQGSQNPISPTMIPATFGYGQQQKVRFQVAYATDLTGNPIQVVLTNLPQAQLVYTVNQQNPQLWDSEFQAAFVATLAAYLTPALNMNKELMQMQIALAKDMISQARIRDGVEGWVSQDRVPDFILARSGYNGYGYGGELGGYCGDYGNLSW